MRSNQLILPRFIIALVLSIVCLTISSCADTLPPEPHKINTIDVIDVAMAEEPSKSPVPAEAVNKSPEPVKALSTSPEPPKAPSRLPEPAKAPSKSRAVSKSPEPTKAPSKSERQWMVAPHSAM